MDRGNENPTQHLPWWLRKTTENPVRLVGTGIRTRDLPNASLVRYHGATSLGIEGLWTDDNQEIKVLVNKRYGHTAHTSSRLLSDILILERFISISIRFQMIDNNTFLVVSPADSIT